MSKQSIFLSMVFFLTTSIVYAEAEFDFETLMETIDTNTHNLQDSITNKDTATATQLATDIQKEFKQVEGFFAQRGNADDAVTDAKQYEDMAADIVKFIAANNFDAAANKAIDMSKACDTACHDTYKPL
ncbi:MAG: hypothetical protein D4R63_11425 [Methylococcaceae bacterium]|nr:MAG: hypothetical protein D4R63_11425 [Methylococcaceae bacterium]